MMKRDSWLRILADNVAQDQVVVAAYSTAFDWIAIRPSAFNYISSGAMGLTSSHALGFALAWPDRKIILLDGDGSLLMNLGSLVTIADAAPENLVHFVSENGVYEANGSHVIPGKDKVNFAGMAENAGYARCLEFSEETDFQEELPAILNTKGPVFVTMKCERGEAYPRDYSQMHGPAVRQRFAEAVADF
tara:strand:- start:8785 stop:9354 length:570 start_codon:yes stop_codon:yes gene_type:complete